MLLFDTYFWIYVSYIAISFGLLLAFFVDAMMRVEFIDKNESIDAIQRLFYEIDAKKTRKIQD